MLKAIYPGSFDPVTNGHLDIITRASKLVDCLVVGILENPNKKNSLFTVDERIEHLKLVTGELENVEVASFKGLLVDFAEKIDAKVVIRGLRAVTDFENEFQMALINKTINPDLETMFLTAESNYTYLSSTVAKEMGRYHVSLNGFIPSEIIADVEKRLEENCRR